MRDSLRDLAKTVANYHNLGVGAMPVGGEKTPHGGGERYNFDRMYLMASNYDFTGKNVVDLGCNSGWFCFQSRLLGSGKTVGIDYEPKTTMGSALRYAVAFEQEFNFGVSFVHQDLETVRFDELARQQGIAAFDAAFVLSVLHHIKKRKRLMERLSENVRDVVFYEDHEFFNDITDGQGRPIPVKGEGYRHGWNEDLGWQRRIGPLADHEPRVLQLFRDSWRWKELCLDDFAEVRFLGFSEKRRPLMAFFKQRQGGQAA